MKVTFTDHSGFLVETESSYLLFDYYKGDIPETDKDKRLFVFCSHSHYDHYSTEIFKLGRDFSAVKFILSDDIREEFDGDLSELSESEAEKTAKNTIFMKPHERLTITKDGLKKERIERLSEDEKVKEHACDKSFFTAETLRSTDLGVAFSVSTEGKRIFHAGDLQWWDWPGEPEEDNENMKREFISEIEKAEGASFDLVFSVLDPRQESSAFLGMDHIAERLKIKTLVPMHFWRRFSIVREYGERLLRGEVKPLNPEMKFVELKSRDESFTV